MKRIITLSLIMATALGMSAQKKIFIPEDMRGMDLNADTSKWCYKRSVQTPDLIFFWEKGFGDDTKNPPALEGKPMSFDINNLQQRVQSFYNYFRDTLKFTRPGSKADRYKMMVMINYSLDGTAYGGTYDNFIGALWVAPNRIQDRRLNCLAHELGHSFQLQIPADSVGDAWGGSGFYEMTSQWMLWRVNPYWIDDETYHFDAFKKLTHKAYLALDNIYHSPYVIEWWAEKRGLTAIADLYRNGKIGEDPVITYKRLYGLSQEEFNDEMFDCYRHLVDFDFKHARKETRKYACTFSSKVDTVKNGAKTAYCRPAEYPEEYGFNAIEIPVTKNKMTISVKGSDLRYGLVEVPYNGSPKYGRMYSEPAAKIKFKTKDRNSIKKLYLVVMGAPKEHHQLQYGDNAKEPVNEYRFMVK